MKLEKIITFANEPARLRFLAMERSLRATGCDLPLWVIPYDNRRFELPPNATWWTNDFYPWLEQERTFRMMLKYQCLTTANYQYVDSDVVFLKNPVEVLADREGFITSCSHWHNPEEAITAQCMAFLKERSTCWQRNVFNCGQFACDTALYTEKELMRTCSDPRYAEICLRVPHTDQPGMVLLVNLTGVTISNLTMPPTFMESTWAEDYDEIENYEDYWRDEKRKPYLIHWAGCDMWLPRRIDQLFTQYFSAAELAAWREEVVAKQQRELKARRSFRQQLRNVARGTRAFIKAYNED